MLSSSVVAQQQLFTTAGGATFTVPAGVLTLKVECVGGGGAGGRVTPSNILDTDAAGGGGGGAYAMSIVPVTAGNTYNLYVGAGGTNTGTSTQGENSWWDTNIVLADGGETRTGNDEVNGVLGGQASNSTGDVTYSGGNGGNGNEGDADGGGGGGAAGSSGQGTNGATVTGGGPTTNYGGYGGSGGDDGAYGDPGGDYGGGGGGSSANGSQDRDGGPGGSGLVAVTWTEVTGMTPASVCAAAMDTIILTGSNFTDVDSVTVNGTSVAYSVDSGVQISITSLNGASSGDVIVYTGHGSAKASSPLNVNNYSVDVIADGTGAVLTADYNGTNGATYQWIDCLNGNAPITGETDTTFTAAVNGLYAVIVSENGCDVQSSCFTVNTVGFSENSIDLQVFPSPTNGWITVNAPQVIERIILLDCTGKVVFSNAIGQYETQLDLSEFASGIYVVKVDLEDQLIQKRIILSH